KLCELGKVGKLNISHFHIFGCKCFVLNNGKDEPAKICKWRTMTVEKCVHVAFDEFYSQKEGRKIVNDLAKTLGNAFLKDHNNVENDENLKETNFENVFLDPVIIKLLASGYTMENRLLHFIIAWFLCPKGAIMPN
ncbi:hypothetical protein CR513_61274, partial [Mucuna pruriens]